MIRNTYDVGSLGTLKYKYLSHNTNCNQVFTGILYKIDKATVAQCRASENIQFI